MAHFETDAEVSESTPDGPILPSLRSRREAERDRMVFRPLLERSTDPDVPVILLVGASQADVKGIDIALEGLRVWRERGGIPPDRGELRPRCP